MTVEDLIGKGIFQVVAEGDDLSREITGIFCCDLLSVAMGRAPSNSAWVTVMGNVNTIAVATLADVSCVILAENAQPDGDVPGKVQAAGGDPACHGGAGV